MTANVDERKVGGELRVTLGYRLLQIARSLQGQAGAHAVHHRKVEGWLKRRAVGRLIKINRAQRMILRYRVFRAFEQTRR